MILLMQQEVVSVGWLSYPEFWDALALGNALPGPIAKMSLCVRFKRAGLPDTLAGLFGTIAPSGVLMLILGCSSCSSESHQSTKSY